MLIRESRSMVPLRVICENVLGKTVDYSQNIIAVSDNAIGHNAIGFATNSALRAEIKALIGQKPLTANYEDPKGFSVNRPINWNVASDASGLITVSKVSSSGTATAFFGGMVVNSNLCLNQGLAESIIPLEKYLGVGITLNSKRSYNDSNSTIADFSYEKGNIKYIGLINFSGAGVNTFLSGMVAPVSLQKQGGIFRWYIDASLLLSMEGENDTSILISQPYPPFYIQYPDWQKNMSLGTLKDGATVLELRLKTTHCHSRILLNLNPGYNKKGTLDSECLLNVICITIYKRILFRSHFLVQLKI